MVLDKFRKINITLNKANQRVLETQIAKVGDVNGRELVVQITNNGVIEDQTGTTLKLNWQHENGNQGSTNFKIVDIRTGRFSVYYPNEMLYKGKVNASIEISSNGQITNSMNFKIIVQGDVFNGEGGTVDGVFISLADVNKKLDDREAEYVELKERQTTVETQFNSIQQEITDKDVVSAPEIIAARNGEANLKTRLDIEHQNVNEQLDQIGGALSNNTPSTYRNFERKPVITFVDDDGKKELFTKLYPIFKQKGVPLTAAIITSRVGNEDTVSAEDIKTMIADGHEMVGHTHNAHSPNMTVVSEEFLINDIIENRKQLNLLGSTSGGFVYPQGQSPLNVRNITRTQFDYAFGGTGYNEDGNIDAMGIKRIGFGNWGAGADLEKYKSDVDRIKTSGGWLVFMLHVGTGDTPEEELAILPELIDYIKAKGIDIVTASEGYDIHGSRVFVGDRSGEYLNITEHGVYGNVDIHIDGILTMNKPFRTGVASSAGISNFSMGQTVDIIPKQFVIDDGGFPTTQTAGIMTTHKYDSTYPSYNYQEFHVYNSNEIYIRHAKNELEWSNWAKIHPIDESSLKIITEAKNSRTNADTPKSYKIGKKTYTEMDNAHMSSAGFPTTSGSLLITDAVVMGYNYGQIRQKLQQFGSTNTWVRSALNDTSWSPWVKTI